MKRFTLLFLIVLFAVPLMAKTVDVETAKTAAKNLYYLKINQVKQTGLDNISLTHIYTETASEVPVYYIFNINNDEGFVIISADDIARPCIGYNFERGFDLSGQAPSFKYFISEIRDQISAAISLKSTPLPEAASEWAELLTETPAITKTRSIQPLLLTMWTQEFPYNEQCPVDAAGPGGHVLVGCIAIAMGQVMKYYNYPVTGTGSHTNYSFNNGGYGNQTVNFAAQTYVWENMPNSLNGSTPEVAKLLFHCGVATDMTWGPDGSGSYSTKIVTALEQYYKYSTSCQYVLRSSYSASAWLTLLKQQIDNEQPMVYSGQSSNGGHAWNCDGYIGDDFHMNWGWGGSSNGYYNLDNLVAGGYDFNSSHGAVINIIPISGYPQGCTTSPKMITGTVGTFNDGSGNTNYSNNKDCYYLIQPACASVIEVSFDRFDLGTGDNVYLYGGTSTSDTLIATFNSTTTPNLGTIYSTTNGALLIRFVTDGSNTGPGWYVSYGTFPCKGTRYVYEQSGYVVDGSLSCDYVNSVVCSWYIQPAGATDFHLTFPEFNLAAGDAGDILKLYKNTLSTQNVIGTYTSNAPPPAFLDVVATKVIVRFQSNSSATAAGWRVDYNATITGIENHLYEFGASVYPNPFRNDATISFNLTENTDVKISVTNVLGETVGYFEQAFNEGEYSLQLSSFSTNISQGMYFVNLSFDDKTTSVRIVCSE